jgi:prolyl-tRNA synthetase
MPDGRTLQSGTVHNLGQNFSKAFNIKFETIEGDHDFVWQTCYGISERSIAALIAVHGDDNGIVLGPKLAPLQIIIIPIPHKESGATILESCSHIAEEMRSLGLKVRIDTRDDLRPGAKFFYWETRGVPIRIEIGPKDLQKDQVIVVRRDTFKKEAYKTGDLKTHIPQIIDLMTKDLRNKAWKWLKTHIFRVDNLQEANELLKRRAGIIELPWCGEEACGHELEEQVKAKVLGTPVDSPEETTGQCAICGKESTKLVRVAVAY